MANYEKEIREMFISVFKEDIVMEDVDHDKAIQMTLAQMVETFHSISDKLQTGINNGYSLELQLSLMSKALKSSFG